MIRIAIIEDEIPARKKIKRLLDEVDGQIKIITEIDTVTMSVAFLQNNTVDLIFSDIELLDGNSFEIYNQVSISCPIIFTTAYDQFWMNAFDTNGIDYLLKPFSKDRFQKAWKKFLLLKQAPNVDDQLLSRLTMVIEQSFTKKSFKKRLTVQNHQGIYFLDTNNITYFESTEGLLFAYDTQGKKHLLTEATLKEIEEHLDPADFYRINRSELIHKIHIERVQRYAKNTLSVKLKGYEQHLVTSQNSTAGFRRWVEG